MVSLAAEFPNDNPALHRGLIWVCLEPVAAPSVDTCALQALEPVVTGPLVESAPPVACISGILPIPPESEGRIPREEIALEDMLVALHAQAPLDDDFADDEPIIIEELEPLDDSYAVEAAVDGMISLVAEAPDVVVAHATTLPPPPEDPFTIFVSTLVDIAIHENAGHVAAALPALLGAGLLPHSMGPEATQALRDGGIADGLDAMPGFSATTAAWSAILRGTSEDFGACGNGMLDEWAADLLARLLGAPPRAPALRRELRARGVAAFGLAYAA